MAALTADPLSPEASCERIKQYVFFIRQRLVESYDAGYVCKRHASLYKKAVLDPVLDALGEVLRDAQRVCEDLSRKTNARAWWPA